MKRAGSRKKSRKTRKMRNKRRPASRRTRQRGGQISAEYPSTVVSYTPKAEPGELGNPDAVPRVGSLDDFKADMGATESGV